VQEQLDETKRNFLQVEAGPAWVYERYFGGDRSGLLGRGVRCARRLPAAVGTWFDWRFDYLPS